MVSATPVWTLLPTSQYACRWTRSNTGQLDTTNATIGRTKWTTAAEWRDVINRYHDDNCDIADFSRFRRQMSPLLNSPPDVDLAIECKSDSIDAIFNDFINIVKWHLNVNVPVRNVSMRERDPSYVTSRIKLLLRKRNKFRRAGKIEHADCIAVKINRLIANNSSTVLAGAHNADIKQLWALLKKTGNWAHRNKLLQTLTLIILMILLCWYRHWSKLWSWSCYTGSSAGSKLPCKPCYIFEIQYWAHTGEDQ